MATKRMMSRQEIHADIGESDTAAEILIKYWRPALAVIALIGAGFIGFKTFSSSRAGAEKDAHALWLRAQQELSRSQFAGAIELANEIRERYPNTTSGQRALVVRADALAGSGDVAGAKTAYEEAAATLDDEIMRTSALRGLAVLLEESGDDAAAADIYRDLGTTAVPTGGRVFDMKSAARTYIAAGQPDAAIAVLEQLIAEFRGERERVIADQVNLAEIQLEEVKTRSGAHSVR